MAKMTEFELGMKELAKIAAEKEQLKDRIAILELRTRAIAAHMWTLDEAKDELGAPVKSIELPDGYRVDRRVVPEYDTFLFEGDCPAEFAILRDKHAKKAAENYSPTQTEMESVYRTRPDGATLRDAHKIGDKTTYALAKSTQ